MSSLIPKIEALLFLKTKPVKLKTMARALDAKLEEVSKAVDALAQKRNTSDSGIHLVVSDEGVVLVSNPELAEMLADQTKEDLQAELTRPQLETLTIIAYRGPVTKAEIEQIRGVNCSVILRNLLMRGLIDEREDDVKLLPVYTLTADMLRHLGIHSVQELPDFEQLHKHAKIDQMLESMGG